MAKELKPIVGNHLFFALEGDTVNATITADDAKPAAPYDRLGWADSFTINPVYSGETKVKRPSPGGYKVKKTRYSSIENNISAILQDLTEFLVSALFIAVGSIDGSKVYEPLSQDSPARGWLRAQQYTEDGDLINTVELWVEIIPGATTFSETPTSIPVAIRVLDNTLNVGQLANLAGAPA